MPIRMAVSKRCGKQGAWRAKPKWVMLTQYSPFHHLQDVVMSSCENICVLAIRRTTKFFVKIHTHDNVSHESFGFFLFLYVGAKPHAATGMPGTRCTVGGWPCALEMIRPDVGKTILNREAAEAEGIISKHDAVMKSSDYQSDLKTAFCGIFAMPDAVNSQPIKNFTLNLHSNQRTEIQEPKTDLSGVLCTLQTMLLMFKDLAAYEETTSRSLD